MSHTEFTPALLDGHMSYTDWGHSRLNGWAQACRTMTEDTAV